ncbi:hypothetical protein [Clostridium scatologenes]|uniref:Uncharacterized protein n=1 Tax=Clostridium scatologenes TaxID=1548 RepID=A0A0E3MAC5_CLOSL|nr:hypothetical protein [Clostridium scatologenes]AKA71953.1 hypothetical protein CSCA_4828 [Clostridium scatologenes]
MTNCEKMGNLNEYIIRNLNMEIMDTEMNAIIPVKDEIEAWEKAKQDPEVIKNLHKFEDYNCIYCLDSEGGLFTQGYAIITKDMEYVGFVETV